MQFPQRLEGTAMPAEKFRTAAQSAGIGGTRDVPHVTEALIDEYVADLRELGLLDARTGAHAA